MKLLILTLLLPLFAKSQNPAIDSLASQRLAYKHSLDSTARSSIPEPDKTILYEWYDMQYRETGERWDKARKEWMDRRKKYLIDSLKKLPK